MAIKMFRVRIVQASRRWLLKFSLHPLPSPTESQEEDGDIEAEEAEGEENDRPYNLRQRKTVERYQAPPIGE